MEFFLGKENGSGIKTFDEEDFICYSQTS